MTRHDDDDDDNRRAEMLGWLLVYCTAFYGGVIVGLLWGLS